jgi:DamX protein
VKDYITRLKLKYDPFDPAAASRNFFTGADRNQLLQDLLDLALEQELLATLIGPLGSGKSTLAREFARRLGNDAVCLTVQATLFMNQNQFLDALGKQLPKHRHIGAMPSTSASAARLCELAADLDMEAQALVIVIDDAHELAAEVLELLGDVYRRSGRARVRVLLLGERPLLNLVETTLPADCRDDLRYFDLPAFTVEDTRDYIEFKLVHAGMGGPLPLAGGVIGRIHNTAAGIPAAINALAVEALDPEAVPAIDDFDQDTHFISATASPEFTRRDFTQIDLDMSEPPPEKPREPKSAATPVPARLELGMVLRELYANQRYWIATALLIAVMFITVAIWDTEDNTVTADIAGAEAVSVNRIVLPAPVPSAAANLAYAADPTPKSGPEVTGATTTVTTSPPPRSEPAAATATITGTDSPVASAAAPEPVAAPKPSSPPKAIADSGATPALKSAPTKTAATPAVGITAYEQKLLAQPARNYTIQLLGSHTEASVQRFITTNAIAGEPGYFETRHQDKPWFVAVTGSFSDRAAASAAIARLPESIRKLQPWVRPLSDIQGDIHQLRKL